MKLTLIFLQQFEKLVLVLIITFFAVLLLLVVKNIIVKKIKDKDLRYHTRKSLDFLSIFIFVVIILVAYREKLGGIGVALGVAGAGIAFALQQVIVSIAGWISILTGKIYKTGDRIQLGGVKGDVIDISVLRTTIMETGQWVDGDLYNGRIVNISNSYIFQDAVFNYSADFPYLWDELKITIQTTSDYKLAKEKFLIIANDATKDFVESSKNDWENLNRKYRIENARVEPMVTLSLNPNGIECIVRYLVEYKKRRIIKDMILEKIFDAINESNHAITLGTSNTQIIYNESHT